MTGIVKQCPLEKSVEKIKGTELETSVPPRLGGEIDFYWIETNCSLAV